MTKCNSPKWSTPERREYLVNLWYKFGNQCLLGHTCCTDFRHYQLISTKRVIIQGADCKHLAKFIVPKDKDGMPVQNWKGQSYFVEYYPIFSTQVPVKSQIRLYDFKADNAIDGWKTHDRQQALSDWELEYRLRHKTNDRKFPLRGQFSGVSQEIYYDRQPLFYLEALGMSGLSLTPFASVRLPSSNQHLHVDLNHALRPLSKNKKRKAIRYGEIPSRLRDTIEQLCWLAVKHYKNL